MSRIARLSASVLVLCAGAAYAADEAPVSSALLPEIEQYRVPVAIESGSVAAPAVGQLRLADLGHQVIYAAEVDVPGASAVRVIFDTAVLDADSDSYIRITSQLDGAVQTLRAEHLVEWKYTSAYFNGDIVSVEILAVPGAEPAEVAISEVIAEFPQQPDRSICGTTDDRVLSSDNRSGRIWPIGCTAWLFDGRSNCLNTAGHCGPVGSDIIEFNVPLSSPSGTPQHPGPQDQYPVDPASIQSNGGLGVGNDWATFGVFDNPNTGLSPLEAYGASYTLASSAPGGTGQPIRVTGYGSTSSPVSPTWYLVQKTHAGPYAGVTGSNIKYAPDTTGGNSGSAVQDDTTGLVIGVHTHAGCTSTGGANNGTAIEYGPWQTALNNPQGVCDVGLNFDFLAEPDFIDPDGGTTISIDVTEDDGVALDPATVVLNYDNGDSTVQIPMTNTVGDTYVATFTSGACGNTGVYFVSAETMGAETYQTTTRQAPIADGLDVFASYNFETNPGFTVADTAITTGTWEIAIPRAEGRGDPLSDYDGSGRCWVTDNGLSADVDGGPTVLTSNLIDLSASNDPVVSYARWHDTNDGSGADALTVQFSDNGGASWTTVETIPSTTGWVLAAHRVSDHVALTSQFQVRWSVQDNPNASVTESAVDAFQVIDVVCGAGCFADCDGNGATNIDDIDCFVAAFLGGDLAGADCDGNGTLNVDDIDCFVAQFLAGCP
ncbi:MAG: hypothetical protein RIB60_01870 [Phycisphaerales bacterium]